MLREFKKEDILAIREWVNELQIVDNLPDNFLHPHTMSETEAYVNAMLERKYSSQEHFVIANIQTEEYLGSISIFNIDYKNRAAEIGIVLGKTGLLSQGIGSVALKLAIKFAFERMNLRRLELNVIGFNHRAQKCYLKCGFKEEGRLRQRHYSKGAYHDVIVMGLLKDETKVVAT